MCQCSLPTGIFFAVVISGLLLCSVVQANIWIDESFDDGVAFNADDLDTYAPYGIGGPNVSVTHTGSVSSAKALLGTHSYQLDAGESISVAEPYGQQGNGPFQYFQFGVHVDEIPSPGTMATFRWDWTFLSKDHSFFVNFVSTGVDVQIIAGEDIAGGTVSRSFLLDTIGDTATWKYLTIQVQKNIPDATEEQILGQVPLSQGAYFYCSSNSPQGVVPLYSEIDFGEKAHGWSLSVFTGRLFVDEIYWEGGLGYDENRNLRPLSLQLLPTPTPSTSVRRELIDYR